MKKSLIVILYFIFLSYNVFSQQLSKQKSLPLNATFFSLDNLGNIYTISEGNILKFDADGNHLYTFSNKGSGEIDFIDATNPLRILVYSKNFSVIYFLDNHLSLQSTLDLRSLLFFDAWPVCNSTSEGFWIYQSQNFSLLKINQNLRTIAQSQPLNLTVADEIKPIMMQESNSYLILLNEAAGFMIFDRLGSYYKTIRKSNIAFFSIYNNQIIYLLQSKLHTLDIKTESEKVYDFLFPDTVLSIGYFNNKVYILNNKTIEIYSETK